MGRGGVTLGLVSFVMTKTIMPKKLGRQTSQSVNGLFRIARRRRQVAAADASALPPAGDAARERDRARRRCAAGVRLPPERDLAASLRVSRATVVSAYRELEARGLVRGYVGRGTFVSARPDTASAPFAWRGKIAAAALQATDTTVRDLVRAASDPALMSLAAGVPALDCFPARRLPAGDEPRARDLGRGAPGVTGRPRACRSFARRSRIVSAASPEHILVLAGAQQGLDLLARCLIDPGDAVIVDRPGYLGAIQTFRNAGARLVGWDISRADPDELEELLLRYRPKLIYTNPTHHNPTGITLSMRTRRELLELAARYRVPIVEDDTYRELALHSMPVPPPSLFKLDESHTVVIRLNSFAKMLAPGLRLGWISAVRPIIDQLALIKQQVDPHTQNLAQLSSASWSNRACSTRHLATLKTEHRRRRDAMVQRAAAACAGRTAALQRSRGRHVSVVRAGAGRARPRRAGPRAARVGDGRSPASRSMSTRRRPRAHLLHLAPADASAPPRCSRARWRAARDDRRAIAAQQPSRTEALPSGRSANLTRRPTTLGDDRAARLKAISCGRSRVNPRHASRQPTRSPSSARSRTSTGCAPPMPTSTKGAHHRAARPRPMARRFCCRSSSSRKTCRSGSRRTSTWLFEFQLAAWTDDESSWPAARDLKTFRAWFRIDVHSVVVDVADDDIEGEEL